MTAPGAMQQRALEPEWLDTLPPEDPRALRSRRDLRRVNAWMGQSRILLRLLGLSMGEWRPRSIIELGSGDGAFMLRLARALSPRWPGVRVTLVDRQEVVAPATVGAIESLGWLVRVVTADVFDALEATEGGSDAIVANLFLHHFSDTALQRLLALAAELAPRFVACEPRRSTVALTASRLLWAIGCNSVTRHDAVVSVRAGFTGRELSRLWPKQAWTLQEHGTGLFTHSFVARAGSELE